MPPAEATGPAVGDDRVVYGLLLLGGIDVALPLSVLREVVPCPATLSPLPVHAPGLLGAVVVRETVLPVVDLRPLAGVAAPRQEHQVVVVVAHGGRLVGLLADEVRGVSRVSPDERFAVDAAGAALLFSHTYLDPDGGSVVSVLDAGTLLGLPGVPTVADAGRTGADGGVPSTVGRGGRTYTVLRCGERLLALDVGSVHTTLPGREPRPSVVDSELCLGTVPFAEHDVTVVDLLALLGLGRAPAGPSGAGLVLDLGVGKVVVALSALLDLRELSAADVLPLPRAAVARPDLLAGLADLDGYGPCLVLDGEALLRDEALRSLARAATRTDAALEERRATRSRTSGPTGSTAGGAPAPGAPVAGLPHLRLLAGVEVAVPLEQVDEIVPVPGGIVTAGAAGAGSVLGVCAHRGQAVPVVSLAALLGQVPGASTAASCLLLVSGPEGQVAFVVDGLHAIDPLRWSDPGQARSAGARDALAGAPLVQLGESARLVPCLDLLDLARAVTGGPGAARGPAARSGVPAPRDPAQVPVQVPAQVPTQVPGR